jgi:hypothetical protein
MWRDNTDRHREAGSRQRGTARERGQALIIAVLVMLVLAALAGLFIVVVSWGLAQSAGESERIGAQYLAEAGVRFASDQLAYGPEGADWRPADADADGWAEYPYGEGRFRVRVSYRPDPTDPMSRDIKIECEGLRSMARYRLVNYKPILLTDYLPFVTNSDKSARKAQLGAGFVPDVKDQDGNLIASTEPYHNFWTGGIRTNSDLEWIGPQDINLITTTPAGCAMRDDKVECSRYISIAEFPGGPVNVALDGGTAATVTATTQDNTFDTVQGHYLDGVVAYTGSEGYSRGASYVEAPMIDLGSQGTAGHRYQVLTRDSGLWKTGPDGQPYNEGWYGYGDGIYIDNYSDTESAKFGIPAGYEAWRQFWANAASSGLYPDPPGVAIWLRPDGTVTLWRQDRSWVERDNPSRFLGPVITLPYPRNGVIYAEGDIRIGGVLPACPLQAIGDHKDDLYPGYYHNDRARRYDLTVVSGGTIYIEGALTSETRGGNPMFASKIALLALENVCLDATEALRPVGTAVRQPGATRIAEIRPGQSYGVEFSTVGMTAADKNAIELCVRQAGTMGPPGLSSQIRLLVDGQPYNFSSTGTSDTYRMSITEPWAEDSAPVVWPYWEEIPCTAPVAKRWRIGPLLSSSPLHRVEFVAPASNTGLPYLLIDLTVQPLTVMVDALVYAQRGSWYVLAGPWFDEGKPDDANRLPAGLQVYYGTSGDPGFPRPKEPAAINLVFNGAISENRTAPVGDVVTWTRRWRGADEWWLAQGVDTPATRGLQYRYDPYLCYDVGANRPRLPRLPVSPTLISLEEAAL